MSLITGNPAGTTEVSEDIYLVGAPSVYIQDYTAPLWYAPDAGGFYWGLTGTSTYNVYEIGCPTDMTFTENIVATDVLCDNIGVKATVQQRQFVEFSFSFQTFFPFQVLRYLLKGGAVTETAPTQKFGLGKINNNLFFHCYCPQIYDEDTGDYVWIMLHKCQFVDPWSIAMSFGNPWKGSGIKLRAFADSTKPAAQSFGMMGRLDASAIV
jgi:hypothetical protein